MAQCGEPLDCPECGTPAPRVVLTAPAIAGMSQARRQAFETNECSAHAPLMSSRDDRGSGHVHGPQCGCASSLKNGHGKGRTRRGADGSKSFPAARPWMISH
jgi:hypothetical protein